MVFLRTAENAAASGHLHALLEDLLGERVGSDRRVSSKCLLNARENWY